jgi:predicted ester cyclase
MTTTQNKGIVIRFNKEVIEQGDALAFDELVSDHVTNHTAAPGMSSGKEGMAYFLLQILKNGFPNRSVEIIEQIAERDFVTTRKRIVAKHEGDLLGISPTGKRVVIDIIDIIRLENGQYAEHWGMSNFSEVLAQLAGK